MVWLIYESNSLQWICLCSSSGEPVQLQGSTRAGGDSSRGTASTTVFPVVKTRYTLTLSGLETVTADTKEQVQSKHLLPSLLSAKPQLCVLSSHHKPQWQDTRELKISATFQAALLTTGVHSTAYNPTSSLEPAFPSSIMDAGHMKSNQKKGLSGKKQVKAINPEEMHNKLLCC